MRPKLNSKDKGQISKPNEYTDNFKSDSTCIFLSVRAKFKKPLCPRTLCNNRELDRMNTFFNTYQSDTYALCAHLLYSVKYVIIRITTEGNTFTKGQLISKGLFGILEFFQKTNQQISS